MFDFSAKNLNTIFAAGFGAVFGLVVAVCILGYASGSDRPPSYFEGKLDDRSYDYITCVKTASKDAYYESHRDWDRCYTVVAQEFGASCYCAGKR